MLLRRAPEGFALDLPEGVTVRTRGSGEADVILSFHTRRADWPSGSRRCASTWTRPPGYGSPGPSAPSKMDTDLTEDVVRELALANTLVDNKVCAIDETWSGLRLVIRLRDR